MPDLEFNQVLDWQERGLHYGDGLFETLLKLNGEILVSKMRLYFDSKKIGDEFFKINIQAGKCSQHIRLGFESTNKESFLKNVRAFDEESKILRNLSDKFEDKLGSQKIRKIVV